MSDPDSLLEKYVKPFVRYQGNPLGALQVAGTIGQGLTGQILSGIKGLSVLPQGTEAAADAVNDYQKKWSELGNPLMGKAGVQAIQDIAPAFRGAAASPLGTAAHRLSSGYGEGSQKWSDLAGKYLGTPAAGAVGATADVLPYLMQPEGLLGKSALEAAPAVTRSFEPLLEDGAHAGTLAREQAAAARRAEDGVRSSDALPSEFQGRQAEHEGAVARRMAKTPRQISAVPATESHLVGAEPDNATVYTAKHPETGELLGHAVAVPRHGGMQMTLIEVDPKYRGEGIGRDLMNSVVADAHGQGLPLHFDTSVSVPQMANVQSSGHTVTMNPHTEEAESPYGPALESTNGQPVYSIHPPTSPEDVAANEPAQGSYVSSQAYAEGGEVGTVLGGLGRLVDQFAPLARHVEQNGGVTYHPGTGKQPVSGYAVSVHKGREASLPSAPDAHELARYTYANRDLFASDPGAHVGVWHDPGSGQHFMDVSQVDPDFSSALKKAQSNSQLGMYDLANGQTIPTTPDTLHFLHMSNLSDPNVTLDPKFYGTGLKGAEARRGGTKVTSLYPADIDPKDIETGLQQRTPYRVSVPADHMYNLSADPGNHLAQMPDFSAVEDAIKDAGYAGYHVPEAQGLMRGQGRMFGPTPATRIGPSRPPEHEDDLSKGFAEGGEVGAIASGLGDLVKRYAPEAEHLADVVADKGNATYSPVTGAVHGSGYVVPTAPSRSLPLDHPPSADYIHDFMMTNQDAFDEDPQAVLHAESDDHGNHFLHVGHYSPDFGHASDVTRQHGLPGFQDIGTGEIHGPSTAPADAATGVASPEDQSLVEKYLQGSPQTTTPWTPGKQTVSNPQRNAFPGIYNDPRQVVADAASKVGPEDPLMRQLFDVSRSDLSETALSRQGNELGRLPGAKTNPQGAASALNVMNPANAQRLVDTLTEARKSPELFKGMTGWYNMDPLYERFRQIFGDDEAPAKYSRFNTLMGMASPGSDVGTEIARGTSAHWLANEGRFNDFLRFGGGMGGDAPADMAGVPGHPYHSTAQGTPMRDYLDTGEIQMQSPKVPPYIQASGVPETGFQTDLPVGDAHFARAVGLADTRNPRTMKGQPVVPKSSVSTPEMQTLHPWWRDRVAAQAGLESVPAQALTWGAYSPYTGVESAIGAPKLEILSTQIGKVAQRLGVSPETARDMVITGKAGAFRDGGSAN